MLRRLFLAILLVGWTPSGHALIFQSICIRLLKFGSEILYPVDVAHLPTNVELVDNTIHHVNKYLGSGRASTVIRVDDTPDNIPRAYKISREAKYNEDLDREWRIYNSSSEDFAGRVIPIYRRTKTKDGRTVLEKPFLDNHSLFSMITQKKLTEAQLVSLKELVGWSDDFYKKTGNFMDINPFNFAWVEDPAVLKLMHKTKPSFVFYEITPGGSKAEYSLYKRYLNRLASYPAASNIRYTDVRALMPTDMALPDGIPQ